MYNSFWAADKQHFLILSQHTPRLSPEHKPSVFMYQRLTSSSSRANSSILHFSSQIATSGLITLIPNLYCLTVLFPGYQVQEFYLWKPIISLYPHLLMRQVSTNHSQVSKSLQTWWPWLYTILQRSVKFPWWSSAHPSVGTQQQSFPLLYFLGIIVKSRTLPLPVCWLLWTDITWILDLYIYGLTCHAVTFLDCLSTFHLLIYRLNALTCHAVRLVVGPLRLRTAAHQGSPSPSLQARTSWLLFPSSFKWKWKC